MKNVDSDLSWSYLQWLQMDCAKNWDAEKDK
jgi:hypothetical protein